MSATLVTLLSRLRSLAAVAVLLAACARPFEPREPDAPRLVIAPRPERAPVAAELLTSRACALPPHHRGAARGIGDARRGSTIAVVQAEKKRLALFLDHDGAVDVVDLDALRFLSRTLVRGGPRELVVMDDGRVAVTLEQDGFVVVFAPLDLADLSAPLEPLCARPLPRGPFGIAVTPEGSEVVVTSGWDPSVIALDAATFEEKWRKALPRSPRGVLVDRDRRAYVTHLVGGRVSMVDLDDARIGHEIPLRVRGVSPEASGSTLEVERAGGQSYALASVSLRPRRPGAFAEDEPRRIVVPMVSVDPGGPDRPVFQYYGPRTDGLAKVLPFAAMIDPVSGRRIGDRVFGAPREEVRPCTIPRALAPDPSTSRVVVACMGIDHVVILDARAVDPFRAELGRVAVAAGPTGIVVDDASRRAYVASQIDAAVTVVDLDTLERTGVVAIPYVPRPPAIREGRAAFYSVRGETSNEGLACASCHPDGLEDGLTWFTPEGPRQTLMLAGRLEGTAPYGWTRGESTLGAYITSTTRRLSGSGFSAPRLEALARYVKSLWVPARPERADEARIARGREVFDSAASGCTECHISPSRVDGQAHPLADKTPFDTPSLVGVSASAPYFHDGRYDSLEALLRDPKSHMGTSATLSVEDRGSLEAYLRSL